MTANVPDWLSDGSSSPPQWSARQQLAEEPRFRSISGTAGRCTLNIFKQWHRHPPYFLIGCYWWRILRVNAYHVISFIRMVNKKSDKQMSDNDERHLSQPDEALKCWNCDSKNWSSVLSVIHLLVVLSLISFAAGHLPYFWMSMCVSNLSRVRYHE